ncbi:hypothetical protein EMCRGX_G032850 [Ephydatia muelleri]|eukprot:Em0019g1062a
MTTRQRRALSAIARPKTSALLRPPSATKPRRPYSAYSLRGAEDDTPKYDPPQSEREWWRYYVKETPNPGTYKIGSFVEDLERKQSTYGFRDSSRAKSAGHTRFQRNGDILLPGAYEHSDFLEAVAKKPATYGFRNTDRYQGPKIGHGYGDKDLDTSPALYSIISDDQANIKQEPQAAFKSQVQRTPGFHIPEKIPGPGQYEGTPVHKGAPITSIFRSKVPRFANSATKVPGPGAYDYRDSVFGQPRPLSAVHLHLKKKHGLSTI